MDSTTRCLHCGKRLVPVASVSGRTELECIWCHDPMSGKSGRWAESSLARPPDRDERDHSGRRAS